MKKAFTLIELMIVLVIIGIMATLAVPRYETYVYNMHGAEAMDNLRALSDAIWVYYIEAKSFPIQLVAGPIPDKFDVKPPQVSQYWTYYYYSSVLGVTIYVEHKVTGGTSLSAAPIGGVFRYEIHMITAPTMGTVAGKPIGEGYYIYFARRIKTSQPSGFKSDVW